MKNASFGFAIFALAALVACGSDDGEGDSPSSPSDPGPVQGPVAATGASIERGRPETTVAGTNPGAGGSGEPAPSANGGNGASGTGPASDAAANNPPPAGTPPPATNPPPANNPQPVSDPPPGTNESDPACAGKAEGDVCGTPSCQSETHTVQGRCDKELTCVYVKIKCDKSCEGGVCVDEKPGNGKDASGGKSKP
ncbi:MAG: hypothetical protein SF187_27610 [Deltaproteobacteria bacterium]|nr:hypothetical protein [Deltaproteobacteria bacterium]